MSELTYTRSPQRKTVKHIGVHIPAKDTDGGEYRVPLCGAKSQAPMIEAHEQIKVCSHCARINNSWPLRALLRRVWQIRCE